MPLCHRGRPGGHRAAPMALTITAFIAASVMAGCTETQISSRRGRFQPESLPPPDRVVVYDFDTAHAEVEIDPSIPAEIARGRARIGEAKRELALAAADALAAALVDEILASGMPAERGRDASVPKPGALIVDGEIVRIDEGNRATRAIVGYGAGRSELRTLVHVYDLTPYGRRRLAEFVVATESPASTDVTTEPVASDPEAQRKDKWSVVAEPVAKKIGQVLAELFAHHGWIADRVL